ncbi:MAG TPA: capsule assembly Wzi family protein [Longimicrobiaceae bacterium]|nr:capsule assembly Wzi family protein [Longimicrobiaceae bacterium]
MGSRPRAALLAAPLLIALSGRAAAQDTTATTPPPSAAIPVPPPIEPLVELQASPLLAEDHWAVRAANRAEALGLAPTYFPAQRAVPRHVVARALAEAAHNAEGRPGLEKLTAGWWARFRSEFPETEGIPNAGLVRLGGFAAAGVEGVEGRLSPRHSPPDDPEAYPLAPEPLPDRTLPFAAADLALAVAPHLAVELQPEVTSRAVAMPAWDAIVGFGRVSLAAGEGPVTYGWERAGGVIFADPRPMPRVEVQTTAPVRLPLRFLGSLSAHAFVSRLDEPRHPGDPWLWGMRLALRPQRRFTLALTRGAMFGGNVSPVTADRLVKSFFGALRQHFDNQILSADVRWRVPTETFMPLTAYLEWAADDGAGAADEQPAILGGFTIPAVPGAPMLSVGAEYAHVAECCSHGSWYIHSEFGGEWARRGRPLGHPLGGGGHEARVYADADLPGELTLSADAFARERGTDSFDPITPGNLFAPTRSGASHGASAQLQWRFLPAAELRARAAREQGSAWHEQSFQVSLRYLF